MAAALLAAVIWAGGCGGDDPSTAEAPPAPTSGSLADAAPQDEARALGDAAPESADSAQESTPAASPEPGATGTPAPATPLPEPTPNPEPPDPARDGTAVHFLFAGYPVAPGPFLVPVHRSVADPGDLEEILRALAAGPTADEAAQGLSTALPAGTRVLGVDVEAGVATVDLSAEFASGGGSLSMLARAAQVVHTATGVAGIDAVLFELEGEPLTVLGGEGLLLDGPQTRIGHDGLLPPIAVEHPAWGAPATSGLTIVGSVAPDVGSVSWVLVDADGTIVAEGLSSAETTADDTAEASGAGARATFRAEAGDGGSGAVSLIVFTTDADGRQRAVLEYPLVPTG